MRLPHVEGAKHTYGSSASTATYKDDTRFAGLGTVTVGATSPTVVTLARTSGGNPSNGGASVTLTATVAGSTPTGNVTFYDGLTPIGTSALNGSYQAGVTTSNLAAGWRAITARYAGDAANQPGVSSPALFQTVNPQPGNGKVKVFILAGQSNMVGHSQVETGRDPDNTSNTNLIGGLGSLRHMLNANPNKYGYLADPAHV